MSPDRQMQVDDACSSLLALSHAIQNRILTAQRRGGLSEDTIRMVRSNLKQMATDVGRLALPKEDEK